MDHLSSKSTFSETLPSYSQIDELTKDHLFHINELTKDHFSSKTTFSETLLSYFHTDELTKYHLFRIKNSPRTTSLLRPLSLKPFGQTSILMNSSPKTTPLFKTSFV